MTPNNNPGDHEVLNIREVTRAETCPASWPKSGKRSWENRNTAPPLVRWKAVHNAIRAWHGAHSAEAAAVALEKALEHLDPVQREICDDLVGAYQRRVDRLANVNFEADPVEVTDVSETYLLRSWPNAVVTHDDQSVEMIKLRTGRSPTEDEEAAVLLVGGPPNTQFSDFMLADDDEIPIKVDADKGSQILAKLFEVRQRIGQQRPNSRHVNPGRHCYVGCLRIAYCGAYPAATGRQPDQKARLLVLSKTALATVARCERRAAWKHVFRIPEDTGRETSDHPNTGLRVHEILEALLLEEDPEPIIEEHLGVLPPADATDVRFCVDNHLTIDTEHDGPISYRRANLQIGVTFIGTSEAAPGAAETPVPVTVVMVCEVDAAGRHADQTAALVEHKTSDRALPYEKDLYAVAGWRTLADSGHPADSLAVHHHFLRRQQEPRCETAYFDATAVAESTDRLQSVADQVAAWDPLDATQPAPKSNFDHYCDTCPFQQRCRRHNGPSPSDIQQ